MMLRNNQITQFNNSFALLIKINLISNPFVINQSRLVQPAANLLHSAVVVTLDCESAINVGACAGCQHFANHLQIVRTWTGYVACGNLHIFYGLSRLLLNCVLSEKQQNWFAHGI